MSWNPHCRIKNKKYNKINTQKYAFLGSPIIQFHHANKSAPKRHYLEFPQAQNREGFQYHPNQRAQKKESNNKENDIKEKGNNISKKKRKKEEERYRL